MGCRFTGAYADDIALLASCKSALYIIIDVCEQYAAELDILYSQNFAIHKICENKIT